MTRALIECMTGAAVLCTAQGTVLYQNRAAERLLNGRASAGKSIFDVGDFERLRSRIRDVVHRSRQRLLDAPADSESEIDVSIPILFDDRWLHVTLQPLAARLGRAANEEREALPDNALAWKDRLVLRLDPENRRPEAAAIPHDVLRTLIETMREPIASVRAAIETIRLYPEMEASTSSQFLEIIETQTEVLGQRLDIAIDAYAAAYRAGGSLKPVAASDLGAAAYAAIEDAVDIPVSRTGGEEAHTVVLADLQALMAVGRFLAQRIENASRCDALLLQVRPVRGLLAIEFEWEGPPVTSARLQEWQEHSLSWGRSIVEMTVREVLDHHDAQIVARSHPDGQCLRILLPQASESVE